MLLFIIDVQRFQSHWRECVVSPSVSFAQLSLFKCQSAKLQLYLQKKKNCIRERGRKKRSQFGTESTRPLPRVPGPTSLRRELLIPIHDTENRCLQVQSAAKRSMQIESPQSYSVLRRVIESAAKLSYFFFRFFNVRSMYTSPQLSINLSNYAKIISVGAYTCQMFVQRSEMKLGSPPYSVYIEVDIARFAWERDDLCSTSIHFLLHILW